MNTIDQNIVLSSLNQSLVPGASLVDGRTELDRLAFFADFASLVNFFDHTNTVHGNWCPFILKDPVFLLAHISATRLHHWKSLYRNEMTRLTNLSIQADVDITVTGAIVNHLLDQLTEICMHIERWTFYMLQSFDYDLKKYVLREVKNTFSEYFWALMTFRDVISRSTPAAGVDPVQYFLFDSYDDITWKRSRGLRPYWEVLKIDESLVKNTKTAAENINCCYPALKNAGKVIFSFLHTIVEHAPHEYERVKKRRSKYPDTTLIRTFEKLLRIYQDEQNRLSQKHLGFYYRDILKQTLQQAIADQVYVCAELAKTNTVYSLGRGTLLNAGTDTQNNPVTFATTGQASLNTATILNAYTLAVAPLTKTLSTLFTQSIPSPGLITKDEQGKVIGWETFGGSEPIGAMQVSTGLILASPILLLQEGDRTITCHLVFEKEISLEFLNAGNYYLSTQAAWLDITSVAEFTQPVFKQVTLTINLPASQPSIVSFAKNPEGMASQWPMLKMEFNCFSDPSDPPVLNEITIEVKAAKLKNFQLYNDYGGLSSKTPFPLFGNIPSVNSNFFIGSAEMFSKPLRSLYMELAWDKSLPDNFQSYYQFYNDYIDGIEQQQLAQQAAEQAAASKPEAPPAGGGGFFGTIGKIFGTLFNPIKKIGKLVGAGAKAVGKLVGGLFSAPRSDADTTPAPDPINIPFNNVCFTVSFSMLDTHSWNLMNVVNVTKVTAGDGNVSFIPYANDGGCLPIATAGPLLFETESADPDKCFLLNGSYFGVPSNDPAMSPFPGTPDACIQLQPLIYSDQSRTGFIKMTLTGPSDGFGTAVYPSVVAATTLENALVISRKPTDPPTPLIGPVNPPFIPKAAGFIAHYSASVTYVFNSTKDDYPIQCFLFSPMANGLIYNNLPGDQVTVGKNITTMPGAKKISKGLPLYPSFPYKGALFLEMDSVIAPSELSLYFQLAKSYGKIPSGNNCHFSYLSNSGWNDLPLLSDGTNQFSCSGIVKVDIPSDISNTNAFIGVDKYWMSIGVTGDPALFSNTVFLKTNGFCATRTGDTFLSDITAPVLAADLIKKPMAAIPLITSLIQPFASFGGKAAEDDSSMNQRISTRLKTKDRAITPEDFYRLIRFAYPEIYYVKAVFDKVSKTTGVYVAKAFDDGSSLSAYAPLITECNESDIQAFLLKRVSVFSGITVSNFDLQFVEVHAEIELEDDFQPEGVFKKINDGLNIFLSPWIASDNPQIKIDQGLSDSQVAAFISTIDGVLSVTDIRFNSWIMKDGARQVIAPGGENEMVPVNDTTLFVSAMNHSIKVTQEITAAI